MPEMFDEFDQKYYSKKYQKALLIQEQKSVELDAKWSFIWVKVFENFESGAILRK